MKITDVRIYPVAPNKADAVLPGSYIGWVFIEIVTDSGLVGIGECSNFPRGGNLIVGRTMEIVRQHLIGRDPSHINKIWQEVFRQYTYLGNRGLMTTIVSGIDIALWDLKGKTLNRPIWDLLGGPMHDEVLLYTHPGGATPDDAAARASACVADGFTAIKFDPFAEVAPRHTDYMGGQISRKGIAAGVEIIAAVREAVGDDIEILIDAHGNYNATTALQCIEALQPYRIGWFEEPVPPEGVDALRQIRRQTNAPLCVGERLFTRWDFLPILQEGLANYVMPDVCWTGGISELRAIAKMAEPYFIPITPHNALGAIQILASSHTMMTVPNFWRQEIVGYFIDDYNKAITPHMDIRGGALHLSDRPGLGVELNHDWIADHPDPYWRPLS